jgi:hypothetical protein
MPELHEGKDKMECRSRHSAPINMEHQPKKEQTTIGILYPDNKNRSYRVNVRPPCWNNAHKLWCGKIKDLEHAKMIADIALFLTGGTRDNKTESYKKILPVDNDDLRSFRTREEFVEYVKSIAKRDENQDKRTEFKIFVNKIMFTAKQDYEEHAKEVAKIVEKPLPLAPSRRNGVPLPKLLAVASSSGSEGLCEDDMEVVDQFTSNESDYINDDMDEDANDALVGVLTSPEANTGDVCADEAVTAKVSGKVECQALDEDDNNECLLGMIAGAHPSYGSPPGFEMSIPGCVMDKGDEDFVYVLLPNVPYFRPNQDNGCLFTYQF